MAALLVTFCILSAIAGINASDPTLAIKANVVTPNKITDVLKKYPHAVKLQRTTYKAVETKDGAATRGASYYYIGAPANGEFLVGADYKNGFYAMPRDVEIKIDYPAPDGCRFTVTSVAIVIVDDGRGDGEAYVISGGIGQREIGILIVQERIRTFESFTNTFGY